MSKKENIQLLLTPAMFWDERPAMTAFNDAEVQESINSAFNLINAECSNLPYKVLEYMAPLLQDPEHEIDKTNDYYRNDYEIDQFRQAIVAQTQYMLNIGNDYSQGSGTFSSGGMSATFQRPEKRDILAPGVVKFLQNARLYQMQVYTSGNKLQNCNIDPCGTLNQFLTVNKGDIRYVQNYQENAKQGQVAFIDHNKKVSFGDPSEIEFKNYKADLIKDRDGEYREIKDVRNLAWFGPQGTDAATKTEINTLLDAYMWFDPNHTYKRGDLMKTWNETYRYFDCWKSNQDGNKGHDPNLDNSEFYWWEKLFNKEIRAKYILDPVDSVYKTINQFSVEYFGGMTREQIYTAINSSGTVYDETLNYRNGFVVIKVVENALKWFQSLQDNNKGHLPETSPEWWKELPMPAIDVNDVVNQVKPLINSIVDSEMDKKLQALQTAITTDFSGSVYAFADEQAFQQFLRDNPKLNAEMFDDVNDSVDLSNVPKLDSENTFTNTNTFRGRVDLLGGVESWKDTKILNDAKLIVGWRNGQEKLIVEPESGTENISITNPRGNIALKSKETLLLGEGGIAMGVGTSNDDVGNGLIMTPSGMIIKTTGPLVLLNPENIANGVSLGPIADPTDDMGAANKKYVDAINTNLKSQINSKIGRLEIKRTHAERTNKTVGRGKWFELLQRNDDDYVPLQGPGVAVLGIWGTIKPRNYTSQTLEFLGNRGYYFGDDGTASWDVQIHISRRPSRVDNSYTWGVYAATSIDNEPVDIGVDIYWYKWVQE